MNEDGVSAMVVLDLYWKTNKEWWHRDEKSLCPVLNDNAPKEAKESYARYLEQRKRGDIS